MSYLAKVSGFFAPFCPTPGIIFQTSKWAEFLLSEVAEID